MWLTRVHCLTQQGCASFGRAELKESTLISFPSSTTFIMDSFDNFQYESASSYGGGPLVDDNSSVYTANTQDNASSVDLSSLSLSEYNCGESAGNGHAHNHHHPQNQTRNGIDEDFEL